MNNPPDGQSGGLLFVVLLVILLPAGCGYDAMLAQNMQRQARLAL